jgi:hypothetical protein
MTGMRHSPQLRLWNDLAMTGPGEASLRGRGTMAHQETVIATASAADLAADMDYHRKTYVVFLNMLKYIIAGCTVILVFLFFLFN